MKEFIEGGTPSEGWRKFRHNQRISSWPGLHVDSYLPKEYQRSDSRPSWLTLENSSNQTVRWWWHQRNLPKVGRNLLPNFWQIWSIPSPSDSVKKELFFVFFASWLAKILFSEARWLPKYSSKYQRLWLVVESLSDSKDKIFISYFGNCMSEKDKCLYLSFSLMQLVTPARKRGAEKKTTCLVSNSYLWIWCLPIISSDWNRNIEFIRLLFHAFGPNIFLLL